MFVRHWQIPESLISLRAGLPTLPYLGPILPLFTPHLGVLSLFSNLQLFFCIVFWVLSVLTEHISTVQTGLPTLSYLLPILPYRHLIWALYSLFLTLNYSSILFSGN